MKKLLLILLMLPTLSFAEIYNSYLITESLKARATLIGGLYFGSGEEFRVNSVDSMDCESRHDLYFKNIDSREIKSY